mmetsp:Transcript_81531/g.235583  ORF Transcript_81531/g.235583 Transcript_81531/m.235583 type:complete len:113 (+) Transcript_81531:85-423(+)
MFGKAAVSAVMALTLALIGGTMAEPNAGVYYYDQRSPDSVEGAARQLSDDNTTDDSDNNMTTTDSDNMDNMTTTESTATSSTTSREQAAGGSVRTALSWLVACSVAAASRLA